MGYATKRAVSGQDRRRLFGRKAKEVDPSERRASAICDGDGYRQRDDETATSLGTIESGAVVMSQDEYTILEVCQMIRDGGEGKYEASLGGHKLTEEAATELSLGILSLATIKRISLSHEILIRGAKGGRKREVLKDIREQQDLLMQLDTENHLRALLSMLIVISSEYLSEDRDDNSGRGKPLLHLID